MLESAGMMRWLLTYADMITLLLIMFIVLYAAASQDISKFRMLAQYLRAAFGGVLQQGPTFLQGSGETVIPDLYPRIQSAVSQFGETKGEGGEAGVSVGIEERGIVVRLMTDNVLFDRGSVDLQDETKRILDALAVPIRESSQPVLVEGHTCDLPMRGAGRRFISNWELSTARASSVVRYLIESGNIPAKRLSAAGYAQFRPVVPNTNEASRRRNRRIDIVILQGSVGMPTADEQSKQ